MSSKIRMDSLIELIHTRKKNKLLLDATTCIDLQNTMLSKKNPDFDQGLSVYPDLSPPCHVSQECSKHCTKSTLETSPMTEVYYKQHVKLLD